MIAGIRPEHFEDARFGDDVADGLRFRANVDVVESMGSELYAYFDIKGTGEVHSEQLDELAADAGMDDVPGGGARTSSRAWTRAATPSTAARSSSSSTRRRSSSSTPTAGAR